MRHDDGVGALGKARLHGGLVLEHVQAAAELRVGIQVVNQRHLTGFIQGNHAREQRLHCRGGGAQSHAERPTLDVVNSAVMR